MALSVSAFAGFLGGYYLGPTFALTQAMATPQMRAMAASLLLFSINLIGMGLGPQVTGLLSDVFATPGDAGAGGLRLALISVTLVNGLAAFAFLGAGRWLQSDLASVRSGA
jgi:MFS family permease